MIEIPKDLKRLAGLVNKFGWESDQFGDEPVGGTVSLTGPVLIYNIKPIYFGVPGFYSREEIQKAYETMYEKEEENVID